MSCSTHDIHFTFDTVLDRDGLRVTSTRGALKLLAKLVPTAQVVSGVRPELVQRMTLPVFATEFNVESLQANVELAAGQGLVKSFDVKTMVWKP